MGARTGVSVELARAPLKYLGLAPREIWLSEVQVRMVLAVPPEHLKASMAICAIEEVETSVISTLGWCSHAGHRIGAGRDGAALYPGGRLSESDVRTIIEELLYNLVIQQYILWPAHIAPGVLNAQPTPCAATPPAHVILITQPCDSYVWNCNLIWASAIISVNRSIGFWPFRPEEQKDDLTLISYSGTVFFIEMNAVPSFLGKVCCLWLLLVWCGEGASGPGKRLALFLHLCTLTIE
jgi:hypothetical protein